MIALALLLAAEPFGTVTGTVRAEKPLRPLPPVKIAKDASVCGAEAARDALAVSDGMVANVVVSLKGAKAAAAPTQNASVDQVGCRYTPHVQAVTVGTALAVLNNDAVLHNVHGTQQLAAGGVPITVFNLAMPFKGQRTPAILRRPGPIKLRCDAGHTWMSAYVYVFDHPFFAVTDAKGRFRIKDVPPGKYTLELWHEPIDDKGKPVVRELPVVVEAGKQTATDATIAL